MPPSALSLTHRRRMWIDTLRRWRNDYFPCITGTSTEKVDECTLMKVWPSLPPSTVADNCPQVAAKASADLSPKALALPAGSNVLVYGHR